MGEFKSERIGNALREEHSLKRAPVDSRLSVHLCVCLEGYWMSRES